MRSKNLAVLTLLACALAAGSARAGEGLTTAEAGDIMLRGRVIGVLPNDDSGGVTGVADSGVGVDDDYTVEIDLTIFATPHWAFEIIAATTNHDIDGEGSLTGLGKLADAGALPPTLLAQYHFSPETVVQPYLGFGVNYTSFYDEDATDALEAALGGKTSVNLEDSWGWAVQAGFDVHVRGGWFFNFDVKYIDMDTTATMNTGGTITKVHVDIDPWVPGIGFGYRW